LRCYIQSRHDLAIERNRAFVRLAELSQPGCKEIISDTDELNIYEEAAATMVSNQEDKKAAAFTSKMRLAAVRANPKKEKLAQDCFHVCVKRSDWDYAQQVCPDRKYFIDCPSILSQDSFQPRKICSRHSMASMEIIYANQLSDCHSPREELPGQPRVPILEAHRHSYVHRECFPTCMQYVGSQ
jgi:hypothetical protein